MGQRLGRTAVFPVMGSACLVAVTLFAPAAQAASEPRPPGHGGTSRLWSFQSESAPPSARQQARRDLLRGPLTGGLRPGGRQSNEPYVPQQGCYAGELPGVAAFRELLLATYPRPEESLHVYNITRGCNVDGISEHEEGRALDFEAHTNRPREDAQARHLLRWLTKNGGYHAKRFGLMYIIYDRHVWGVYNQSWRRMSNRGSVTDNHRDHVHFSFTWNGALRRTAYWTGRTPPTDFGPCPKWRGHFAPVAPERLQGNPRHHPCGSPRPIPDRWRFGPSVMYWQSGKPVRWVQQFLTEEGQYTGLVNGEFGSLTFQAVQRYQWAVGLPGTGVWDPATQNKSKRAVGVRTPSDIVVDPLPTTVAPDQELAIAASVGGRWPERPRSVRLERLAQSGQVDQPGQSGEWEIVSTAISEPGGAVLLTTAVPVGEWSYRVVAEQTSYAKRVVSEPQQVSVVPDSVTPIVDPSSTP